MTMGLLTRFRRKTPDPYAELGGVFTIRVTRHAQERAEERFGIDIWQVIQDVAQAGEYERIGPRLAHHARFRRGRARNGALLAWTEDAERVYVVRAHGRGWTVFTVVESEAKPIQPWQEKLLHLTHGLSSD